jgi:hypothetical protein
MSESCWRLLAAFLLILAAALLRAQDATDRSPLLSPKWEAARFSTARDGLNRPVPFLPPQGYPAPSGPLTFQQIVHAAGIIFSGRVISIGRSRRFGEHGPPSTAVTFQVEQALRGTSAGRNLTIREWSGLWTSGERYHVGQRVLLFLYARSKLGLTSPVAGALGRFAMDASGTVLVNAPQAATLGTDPILGGKTFLSYVDFALAVQRFSPQE